MNHKIFCAIVIVFAELFATANLHAGCHQLYRHHAVHAVVQPVVLYSVGDQLRIEAAVEKALQKRAAEDGTLQHKAPVSVLTAKCARCHTGEAAKGGFDLSQGVTDAEFRRVVEMIGANRNVPDAMKGVIGSLTPADKGAITDELLNKPSNEPGVLR